MAPVPMIRSAFILILSFWPLRMLLRLCFGLASALGRLRSLCYCAAIVPAPHRRNVRLHWTVEVKYPEKIEWGNGLVVGPGCTLGGYGGISFGNQVHLSKDVTIETAGLDLS